MIVLGIIISALIAWAVVIYNGLVARRNECANSFSQIDVQLKRRYDLIPNIVNVAKGYLDHERETLEKVVQARNAAVSMLEKASGSMQAKDLAALGAAEQVLGQALGGLNVAVEAYPDLKADGTMSNLMEELVSTENRISGARRLFNDTVMSFNTYRQTFPNVIFAAPFGFREDAGLLEFEEKAEIDKPPKLNF